MFVWRKRARAVWLAANEAALREVVGQRLAIISRPHRTSAIAEIAGRSRRDLEKIRSALAERSKSYHAVGWPGSREREKPSP